MGIRRYFHGAIAVPSYPIPDAIPVTREGTDDLSRKFAQFFRYREAMLAALFPPGRGGSPPLGDAVRAINKYVSQLPFLTQLYDDGRRAITSRLKFNWTVVCGLKPKRCTYTKSAMGEVCMVLTVKSMFHIRCAASIAENALNKEDFIDCAGHAVDLLREASAVHRYVAQTVLGGGQAAALANEAAETNPEYHQMMEYVCLAYASFVALRKAQVKEFLPEVLARISASVFRYFDMALTKLEGMGRNARLANSAFVSFIRISAVVHKAYAWKCWSGHLWGLKSYGEAICCLTAARSELELLRGPKGKNPLPAFATAVLHVVVEQREKYAKANFENYAKPVPDEKEAQKHFPDGKELFPSAKRFELAGDDVEEAGRGG
eukprot:CAMPEP_0113899048 /NCGR_PEP_ID=MMETSP0780_2-20120614/19767_1 /TAXON_ID=652834 /ORGANISM="Palpitomonas bilix" /LENGTH=375 /DNA_ID=CAMNT_0000891077 /DNA_START=365 /DNA_END=1489 /DNA_ORIENTATION=+ /assembly_acc=CAM_ASM_000599